MNGSLICDDRYLKTKKGMCVPGSYQIQNAAPQFPKTGDRSFSVDLSKGAPNVSRKTTSPKDNRGVCSVSMSS